MIAFIWTLKKSKNVETENKEVSLGYNRNRLQMEIKEHVRDKKSYSWIVMIFGQLYILQNIIRLYSSNGCILLSYVDHNLINFLK
jgi:hypothetical protein